MSFNEWLQRRGYTDPGALTATETAALRRQWEIWKNQTGEPDDTPPAAVPPAATDAAPAARPAVPSEPADADPPARMELRSAGLVEAMREAQLTLAREDRERAAAIREAAAGLDIDPAIVQAQIDAGATVDQARAAYLSAVRSSRSVQTGGPAIQVRDHDAECTADVLGAALCLTAGLSVIDRRADDATRQRQTRLAERAERYQGMTLREVCHEALRMSGRPRHRYHANAIVESFSTGDLANIFTTIANASLMAGYNETPDSTVGWVREVDRPDFRDHTSIRLETSPALELLPRGREAAHSKMSDTGETGRVRRFARQFVVDEQDVIDDRMDALTQVPAMFGSAARRLRPDLVYGTLLKNSGLGPTMSDSVALWDAAGHANYGTTGTALSGSTLQTGCAAISAQTENGVSLNIIPRFLIVPVALQFTARQLITSAEVRELSSTTVARYGTRNPLLDLNMELRIEARIDNGLTDPVSDEAISGSTARWLLAADPMQAPTVEVAYRSGTGRRPVIRSFVLSEGRWGIGWDISFDLGVKPLDWRAMYHATGAS